MDVRQIRYDLTVAKELGFTKAAQQLSISQSAVSEQVKLLEADIGFALFLRTGRGVELTERGRTFLAEATRVTRELLNLSYVASRLKGGGETLRIGMGAGLAATLLPTLFAAGSLPANLLLEIRTASTRVIFDELHAERMDIGVAVEVSQDRTLSSLTVQHLYEMNMAAIAPPGMKLPMARGHVDLARLGNTPLIMNELSVGYGCLVNSLLNDLGVRPSICAIVDNVETIKMMVRSGLGTAIVQSTANVQTLDALIPARVLVPSRATKRPELDALLKHQRISNYTVYCTSKFYGLQPA